MGLHTTCALSFTELDDLLQDQYNTLNKSRVALVGGYQLEAFGVD